eukprot:8846704-Alexandrium_andersonii.AAC.1
MTAAARAAAAKPREPEPRQSRTRATLRAKPLVVIPHQTPHPPPQRALSQGHHQSGRGAESLWEKALEQSGAQLRGRVRIRAS